MFLLLTAVRLSLANNPSSPTWHGTWHGMAWHGAALSVVYSELYARQFPGAMPGRRGGDLVSQRIKSQARGDRSFQNEEGKKEDGINMDNEFGITGVAGRPRGPWRRRAARAARASACNEHAYEHGAPVRKRVRSFPITLRPRSRTWAIRRVAPAAHLPFRRLRRRAPL